MSLQLSLLNDHEFDQITKTIWFGWKSSLSPLCWVPREVIRHITEYLHDIRQPDIFSEADNEQNTKYGEYTIYHTNPTRSEHQTIFVGATLLKLVERATTEEITDENFMETFAATFPTFTTPTELLDLLIARFHQRRPPCMTNDELEIWKNKVLKIRERVLKILWLWIDCYWNDFKNEELFSKFGKFVNQDISVLATSGLLHHLEHNLKYGKKQKLGLVPDIPPTPIVPTKKNASPWSLMDFDAIEIARQLTLMEHEMFRSIQLTEWFNCAWMKPDKEEKSPNIMKCIRQFNKISGMVASEIVKHESPPARKKILAKWLKVGRVLHQLKNVSTLMILMAGLGSSPINRLKQTWKLLSSSQKERFGELQNLVSRNSSFLELRRFTQHSQLPLLPYLGMKLTDLTFIEDGNPDHLENGLINWMKRVRCHAVIQDIQKYQRVGYNFEPVEAIQQCIQNYTPLIETEICQLSENYEP